MISKILIPKTREDVLEAIRTNPVTSYRLSSFCRLIGPDDAKKLQDWSWSVFHINPKDMEVKQMSDDGFFGGCLMRALGQGRGYSNSNEFASNLKYKVMRWKGYYIYPREAFGDLIIEFMDQNHLKKMMKKVQ